MLVGEIELQRVARQSERSPILPAPWSEADPLERRRGRRGWRHEPSLPVPTLDAILLVPRRAALDAFLGAGWVPWATPIGLDAGRRRLLNVDLSEPEVCFRKDGDVVAVAHVEVDRDGHVTVVEVVGAEPADPMRVSLALLGGGSAAHRRRRGRARVGVGPRVRRDDGDPGRGGAAWMCAERAYGDRLWLVASVVRRP